MAIGYAGVGKVQASLSGTLGAGLPQPSSTQTVVHAFKTFTGGTGDQTLYTVTGGKTFYCTGIFINIGSLSTLIFKNNAGTTILTCQSPGGQYFYDFSSSPFTSTDIIKMSQADQPGGANYYTLIGYEVTT
jgi:hypothetical protein